MGKPLGTRAVEKGIVSTEELRKALQRQQMFGGKLGYNMVALGYMSDPELAGLLQYFPEPPKDVEETKLDSDFISDLILKHALYIKSFTIPSLSDKTKLPDSVISQCVSELRHNRLTEITKADPSFSYKEYEYRITDAGIRRALSLLEESKYVGPAPVALEDYCYSVEIQSIRSIDVGKEAIEKAFADIVIDEKKLNTVGAALNSGKPIFLYGPTGNGKSTIAEAIGRSLPGGIFIPYAVLIGGQVITVYDQVNHRGTGEVFEDDPHDARWVRVKRPVIFAGGELTLKALDLEYNPGAGFYQAPLQMKANNGIFVVDDFGRQQVNPESLLNRWIVPLDRRVDFLTLHTGMKFDIPFDQLVLFSTNIEPTKLADEAFLRRLRYKLKVDYPTPKLYAHIFQKVCKANGLKIDRPVFEYLMGKYESWKIKPLGCHPRDLVDQIIDQASFEERSPEITKESIDDAWENYFVNT